MMGFGDRIVKIRGSLSQEEFSLKVGVHKNTIGRWEREQRTPDLLDLNKLIELYPEINPEWLLTGKGDMHRKEDFSRYKVAPYGSGNVTIRINALEAAIATTEEVISLKGKKVSAQKKAQGIRRVYEFFMEGKENFMHETSEVIKRLSDII